MSLSSKSQTFESQTDSLINLLETKTNPIEKVETLLKLGNKYKYVSLEDGLKYTTEALDEAQKVNYKAGIAKSNRVLGYLNLMNQNYQSALQNIENALTIYDEIPDKGAYWETKRELGVIYYEMGDYPKSIDIYFDVLKYYEDNFDSTGIATVLNNLGILFHRQDNPSKALEYYRQALETLKKEKDDRSEIYLKLQTNKGLSHMALDDFEKAESAFISSLDASEKMNNPYFLTVNIGNLATVYAKQKNYKKAEEYFKRAIEKSQDLKNSQSEAVTKGDLATLYLEMAEEAIPAEKSKLINLAMTNLREAMPELKKNNDLRRYQALLEQLSKAYELQGDYRKSLEVFKEHSIYKDSVFNDEIRKELTQREIGYEFSKREDSIRLQSEKEIAIRDATLEANKRQKLLLLAGLLMLGIIGAMLYNQSRIRKINNDKLTKINHELNLANQIKARFFGILSHDFRSPISNIIKLIRLQQQSETALNEDTKIRLKQQTLASTESLLSTMDDLLLWSKGQMENFNPKFSEVSVENIFAEFERFFRDNYLISVEFHNPENITLCTDENFLKAIIRNLTTNALKATTENKNPKIVWEAFESDNQKFLSVSDNGKGADEKKFRALFDESKAIGTQSGLGLHIVRDMAKAINCRVEVSSKPGHGTVIKLIFD